MRNAPSVIYPVGRCRLYGTLLLLTGALAFAVWLYGMSLFPAQARWWGGVAVGEQGAAWAGGGLWLLWSGFAWRSWRRMPVGWLQWSAGAGLRGQSGEWHWRSAAQEDGALLLHVALVLDLQSHALLSLRNPDAAHRWIWVEAARDPLRWHDLRRALRAARA